MALSILNAEARALEPIQGAQVWRAADVAADDSWVIDLGGDLIIQEEGLPGLESTPDGRLVIASQRIRSQLFEGRGFALIRGLPIQSEEEASDAFLRLGEKLGAPMIQNQEGRLLERVTDEGSAGATAAKTTRALVPHTDFTTITSDVEKAHVPVLGLLVVRRAKDGGESQLASGHAAHNDLLGNERVLRRLYSQFCFDRSGDLTPGESPVLTTPVFRRVGRDVRVCYNYPRIIRGHRMVGRPLAQTDLEALKALNRVLTSCEYTHTFSLAPGDALFVNNWVVVHNRTAFEDYNEPGRKRLLLRLWIR